MFPRAGFKSVLLKITGYMNIHAFMIAWVCKLGKKITVSLLYVAVCHNKRNEGLSLAELINGSAPNVEYYIYILYLNTLKGTTETLEVERINRWLKAEAR